MTNRRDFIKKTLLTGAAAFAAPSFLHSENEMPAIASLANESNMKKENDNNPLIIPKNNGLRITGTLVTVFITIEQPKLIRNIRV